MKRLQGVVKFFNLERGYGFITPEGGGRDVFVHITAVHQAGIASLESGMRVSFLLEEAPAGRGRQATALQLLGEVIGTRDREDREGAEAPADIPEKADV